MDFTKFSEESFDLKEWINSAFLSQKETNQNIEQFVATLVTKLQVFIQEINNSIDETSQQTIQNFPRILREIEVLKQEAFMLKEQMKNVRDDILKVEKNTLNESMKLLLELDIIRTNFLSLQIALQEADNWSTLTSDLDSILNSKDVIKISNHIESMRNTLMLLEDDSIDYVNRCTLLEDFKNKFETLMSPDITNSFCNKSVEQSKNYVQIFGRMNRLDELKKYYYQCEKSKVFEKINEMMSESSKLFNGSSVMFTVNDPIAEDSKTKGDCLNNMLNDWLDFLIQTWHNEIQWCKNIFNDYHSIVINLLTKSFEEFNKNFIKFLQDYINSSKNDGFILEYLNKFKQETDRFTLTIYSSAESALIVKNSNFNDLLYKLFQQSYLPYKKVSKQYTTLVSKYLQYELETKIKLNDDDIVECVQSLNNSVTKIFNLIDKEISRCISLTNGCAFSMLIESFKVFLKSYVEEFKRIVVNLKERKKDIQPTKSDLEDWETFRHFVKIIQIVGDLIIRYENLEEQLEKSIQSNFIHKPVTRANSLSSPAVQNAQTFQFDSNIANQQQFNLLSINNFKEYLLEDTEKLKLNSLIQIIESGDDYSIMKDLLKPLYLLSETVHKFAFEIVFAPIKHILKAVSKSNVWQKNDDKSEEVPLFALAPQEFITKIGQYLLTLPQNFEPFTMQNNDNLIVALRKSKLPYLDEKDLNEDITSCWIDSIANATYVTFCEEILKISQIPVNSQRQLIIDIEFISSIFDDVGLKDYSSLTNVIELLKTSKEEFENATKNKPVRIVSAIRKMRNF